MTRVIEVLQTILPVMIMLCIGMICRSRQLISREGINSLKSVAVNIALPSPFVLPVFADDPDQRVYVSSALSISTIVAIAGFAVLAAAGI